RAVVTADAAPDPTAARLGERMYACTVGTNSTAAAARRGASPSESLLWSRGGASVALRADARVRGSRWSVMELVLQQLPLPIPDILHLQSPSGAATTLARLGVSPSAAAEPPLPAHLAVRHHSSGAPAPHAAVGASLSAPHSLAPPPPPPPLSSS